MHTVYVKYDNSLKPLDEILWNRELDNYKGKRVLIEIKSYSELKSLNQLRYIHSILKIIGNELGYELDEIKTIMKEKFGYYNFISDKETEEILKQYKSLAVITQKEMSEFIDFVVRFATENNIQIPIIEEDRDIITELEREKFLEYVNKHWDKIAVKFQKELLKRYGIIEFIFSKSQAKSLMKEIHNLTYYLKK